MYFIISTAIQKFEVSKIFSFLKESILCPPVLLLFDQNIVKTAVYYYNVKYCFYYILKCNVFL